MQEFQLNEADADLRVLFVDMTDAAETPTVALCKADEASFGAISPTVAEVGNDQFKITLDAADLDTPGRALLRVVASGAVTKFPQINVTDRTRELHLAKAALANKKAKTLATMTRKSEVGMRWAP